MKALFRRKTVTLQPKKIHKPNNGLHWTPRYAYDTPESLNLKDEKNQVQMNILDSLFDEKKVSIKKKFLKIF
jgi:hypothetical protein